MNKSILEKIREKREFSQLPEKDIEIAFSHFEKRQVSEEEKIRLTKELLRKVFSVFISKKLLSLKNKEPEWILRKHISTRERLSHYEEIYRKIFKGYKEASVIDLGAGTNGFSYDFFKKIGVKVRYFAIEAVGQLVELMNYFFKENKLNARHSQVRSGSSESQAKAIHLSLFEKEKVKEIISEKKKPRVVFLFKVIDSLEMLKKDYSKELIFSIASVSDRIVVSFATRSLGNRKKFKVKRNWIIDFIKGRFNLLDDFELGTERYLVFSK